jgi:hypothetical protein
MKACILLPVYNDWKCLPRLLSEIEKALSTIDASATVVILNDGGDPAYNSKDFLDQAYSRIVDFQMIELVRNVGNQNALSIGLSFIRDEIECDIVIVMDSDGQDLPGDLPLLISTHREHPEALITAERSGRSEGLLFKACYKIYRRTFTALTGKRLTFGNFSVIPSRHLARLCIMAELPINFAAALIKSRLPIHCVPCFRADRYDGVTSQNFVGLIIHGINGVRVFSEVALVRVSLYSGIFILGTLAAIVVVTAIRFFTDLAIPGWTSNLVGIFLILICQALLLSLVAIFIRTERPMALIADSKSYTQAIASVTRIKGREIAATTA